MGIMGLVVPKADYIYMHCQPCSDDYDFNKIYEILQGRSYPYTTITMTPGAIAELIRE